MIGILEPHQSQEWSLDAFRKGSGQHQSLMEISSDSFPKMKIGGFLWSPGFRFGRPYPTRMVCHTWSYMGSCTDEGKNEGIEQKLCRIEMHWAQSAGCWRTNVHHAMAAKNVTKTCSTSAAGVIKLAVGKLKRKLCDEAAFASQKTIFHSGVAAHECGAGCFSQVWRGISGFCARDNLDRKQSRNTHGAFGWERRWAMIATPILWCKHDTQTIFPSLVQDNRTH